MNIQIAQEQQGRLSSFASLSGRVAIASPSAVRYCGNFLDTRTTGGDMMAARPANAMSDEGRPYKITMIFVQNHIRAFAAVFFPPPCCGLLPNCYILKRTPNLLLEADSAVTG